MSSSTVLKFIVGILMYSLFKIMNIYHCNIIIRFLLMYCLLPTCLPIAAVNILNLTTDILQSCVTSLYVLFYGLCGYDIWTKIPKLESYQILLPGKLLIITSVWEAKSMIQIESHSYRHGLTTQCKNFSEILMWDWNVHMFIYYYYLVK